MGGRTRNGRCWRTYGGSSRAERGKKEGDDDWSFHCVNLRKGFRSFGGFWPVGYVVICTESVRRLSRTSQLGLVLAFNLYTTSQTQACPRAPRSLARMWSRKSAVASETRRSSHSHSMLSIGFCSTLSDNLGLEGDLLGRAWAYHVPVQPLEVLNSQIRKG